MTRGHHEIASIEALGLLGMLIPLFARPIGDKLKRIFRGKDDTK